MILPQIDLELQRLLALPAPGQIGMVVRNLGFMVDGIDARIAALKQLGIGLLQSGKRPGRSFAYMDTEPLLGTIIEYRERTA